MDSSIAYRELHIEELDAAAEIIGLGMRDNPIHEFVFGSDPGKRVTRLIRFYEQALPMIHGKGRVLGAFQDARLVGIVGMTAPGRCRISLRDILRILPRLLFRIPPSALVRLRGWVSAWSRLDLDEPHWHLGPAAVLPSLQGRGIGSDYLISLCGWLDREGILAYLETEREGNVRLYSRFGFEIVRQADVLGIPCWFMKRDPRRSRLHG